MTCPTNEQLSAYHDGQLDAQLDASAGAALAAHVASCAACAAELARLAEVSRLFAAAPAPRFGEPMRRRLHERANVFMQTGVRRLAWVVDAVAACLLVTGSIWLMHGQSNASAAAPSAAAAPPPWVKVDPPADTDSVAREGSSPVAQWYLADASNNREDQ